MTLTLNQASPAKAYADDAAARFVPAVRSLCWTHLALPRGGRFNSMTIRSALKTSSKNASDPRSANMVRFRVDNVRH